MFLFRSSLRPRNPLARLIGSILGLLAVLGALALGIFAFAALLVGGTLWVLVNALRGKRRAGPRPVSTPADSGIIDGEFTVVREIDRSAMVIERSTTSPAHGRHG